MAVTDATLKLTGTLTTSGALGVFDTANGVPAASPINPLTGPGSPAPSSYYIKFKITAAPTGTTPTIIPELYDSDDSVTFFPRAFAMDSPGVSNTLSTAVEVVIPIVTKRRYIQVYGTVGGTSTPTFVCAADLELCYP